MQPLFHAAVTLSYSYIILVLRKQVYGSKITMDSPNVTLLTLMSNISTITHKNKEAIFLEPVRYVNAADKSKATVVIYGQTGQWPTQDSQREHPCQSHFLSTINIFNLQTPTELARNLIPLAGNTTYVVKNFTVFVERILELQTIPQDILVILYVKAFHTGPGPSSTHNSRGQVGQGPTCT